MTKADDFINACTDDTNEGGLTKREYFAELAMQGVIAKNKPGLSDVTENVAHWAVEMADALIKELNKADQKVEPENNLHPTFQKIIKPFMP